MPKLHLILLFILLACPVVLRAQQEAVWPLGGGGLGFTGTTATILPPNAASDFKEASAAVCDDNGQLLFYTNGQDAWDRNHSPMPNGNNLANGYSTESTTQGTLIIPVPEQAAHYYIFSLTAMENGANGGKLYYSKVDISLNNGLGDIVVGEKSILVDSNLTEKLTGITGDQCNIWVLVRDRTNSSFKAFEVTYTGINTSPVLSSSGSINFNNYVLGELIPSPDGRKVLSCAARPGGGGALEIFDFDPSTGILSNALVIDDSLPYYSACFSPDQSKVYAMNYWQNTHIYQFDLNTSIPSLTRSLLGPCSSFDKIKLAPDGKIYFKGGIDFLGAISTPNLAGPACGFTSNALQFGNDITGALPNQVPILTYDTAQGVVTNLNPHCWHSMLTLHADHSGWDHLWNTGATGQAIAITDPGTYWVNYKTAPCVYHTDTFQVPYPLAALPQLNISAACKSRTNGMVFSAPHSGDTVSYHYYWLNSSHDTLSTTDSLQNVAAGSYSVYIYTSAGCDTLLFFDIPEEDFQVSFTVSDTLICLGDTLQFTNISDNHFTTFHWNFGNGDSLSQHTPPDYLYVSSGVYRVQLAGTGEICKDTTYQTILVDRPPIPHFDAAPKEVCAGQTVYLIPHIDSTISQINWIFGEDEYREQPAVQQQYRHAFDHRGAYPVTLNVQSRACPDTSYTDSITVYPLPEVDLGSDSSICPHRPPLFLKNIRKTAPNPYRQVWSTGDTTEVLKVVHPGIYTLSVTTEPIGCTTKESVIIAKDCYIDIPNAFTPNGDGSNDYFFPRQLSSESISRFHLRVFNRWGQIVFESSSLNGRGWDGRFRNSPQPTGVYLYRISVDFLNERQENYEGNVTLMR